MEDVTWNDRTFPPPPPAQHTRRLSEVARGVACGTRVYCPAAGRVVDTVTGPDGSYTCSGCGLTVRVVTP